MVKFHACLEYTCEVPLYGRVVYLWINWHHPPGSMYCCGGLPALWTMGLPAAHVSHTHTAVSGLRAMREYLTTNWSLYRSQSARYEQMWRVFGGDFFKDSFTNSWDSIEARTVSRLRLSSNSRACILSLFWASDGELEPLTFGPMHVTCMWSNISQCVLT